MALSVDSQEIPQVQQVLKKNKKNYNRALLEEGHKTRLEFKAATALTAGSQKRKIKGKKIWLTYHNTSCLQLSVEILYW